MKFKQSYRFITLILIGMLSIAFSQSFATVVKVETAKNQQSKDNNEQEQQQEHQLKTYEAVITVDQNVITSDVSFLPSSDFPDELETEHLATQQLNKSVLSYYEVLFETSICTNAP